MALWNKNKTESPVVRRFSDFMGWIGLGNASAPNLTAQAALETAAVLCAVKVIAEGLGQMPLRLIETTSVNGLDRTRVAKEHWAHRLLAVKPNGFQTSSEFIESLAINAVLGKGFLAIKNIVGNEVREILPIPSGAWQAEITENYEVFYTVQYANGRQQTFHQNQCLFVKGLSLDGLEGISALEKARKVIGISNSLEQQQLKVSSSGGRPSGVLSFENELTPETRTNLAETWKQRWGAGGEGGIAVLDGAAKFSPITLSMADSQFIENRKFQIEEIARIFRVQPSYLMIAQTAKDSNGESAARAHVTHTLGPWIRRIESALNKSILNDVDGLHFDFDERELLRGDHATQATYFKSALGSGGTPAWMTVNEIRYECGLDPVDEEWARKPSKGGYAEAAGINEADPSDDEAA